MRLAVLVTTFALTAAVASAQQAPAPAADRAAPRTDQNSMIAHAQLLEKAKQGRIDCRPSTPSMRESPRSRTASA